MSSNDIVIPEGDEDLEEEDNVPELPMPTHIGKVSNESKLVLSKALNNRMEPSTFKQRFAAQESAGEAFLNRSAQLGALLGRRTSLTKMKKMNIIKKGSSQLQRQQQALKLEQTRNQLSGLLKNRATKDDLTKRNILLLEDINLEDEDDARDQLKEAKKLLSNFLLARPDQKVLRSRHILPEQEAGKNHLEAKNVLNSFLLARPAPEALARDHILSGISKESIISTASTGSVADQLVPRIVDLLAGVKVTMVSCGWGHTAACTDDGGLWVFGIKDNGRLGLGEMKEQPAEPRVIESLKAIGPVTSVSCGDNHTAAILGGKVYTWGMGSWGRLGLGHQEDVWTPTLVDAPGETAVQVACGSYHTLFLAEEKNTVYGFGWNKNGRVGVGKEAGTSVLVPTRVPYISGDKTTVLSMECGTGMSIAVTDLGVFTWGAGIYGCHGHGTTEDEWHPKKLEGLEGVVRATCGSNHCLAVTKEGKCFAWGQNNHGQLGLPADQKEVRVPTEIPLEDVQAVAAGKTHSLASTSTALYSWGRGTNGCLGHGDDNCQSAPKVVEDVEGTIVSMSASWVHTGVVTGEGVLFTFGNGQNHKLGYAAS